MKFIILLFALLSLSINVHLQSEELYTNKSDEILYVKLYQGEKFALKFQKEPTIKIKKDANGKTFIEIFAKNGNLLQLLEVKPRNNDLQSVVNEIIRDMESNKNIVNLTILDESYRSFECYFEVESKQNKQIFCKKTIIASSRNVYFFTTKSLKKDELNKHESFVSLFFIQH